MRAYARFTWCAESAVSLNHTGDTDDYIKRDKFYAKARERGHSGGLYEVASELEDLMELM